MEITPLLLTKHLSALIGRSVSVVRDEKPVFSSTVLHACYDMPSSFDAAVIKMDFALLASLSGLMMGVPAPVVAAQVKAGVLGDQLDDPAREVMNVMAAVFQSKRVLFKGLFRNPAERSPEAAAIVKGSWVSMLPVKVSLQGYPGGVMSIASNF